MLVAAFIAADVSSAFASTTPIPIAKTDINTAKKAAKKMRAFAVSHGLSATYQADGSWYTLLVYSKNSSHYTFKVNNAGKWLADIGDDKWADFSKTELENWIKDHSKTLSLEQKTQIAADRLRIYAEAKGWNTAKDTGAKATTTHIWAKLNVEKEKYVFKFRIGGKKQKANPKYQFYDGEAQKWVTCELSDIEKALKDY